ncbi:MAG: cyanophycinase [Acidobacteriota bacterium]
MNRRHARAIVILVLLVAAVEPPGVAAPAPRVGPAHGHLVIVGGGMRSPEILKRFMELAGGPGAPIVVVPTALEGDLDDRVEEFARPFHDAGFRDVSVLHTRDRERADTVEFVAPIDRARGVWFGGGRQWRLVDAYAGTSTEEAFHAVLDRGGVIGGSSAGATIQGSYLVRGAPEGNTIMMAPGHEAGFGFLHGVAIDQHVIARDRQDDLLPVIEAHPELLGLGIDEDTALVVDGDRAEVIGSSRVLVYDHARFAKDEAHPYFELAPGEVLDLAARRALAHAHRFDPAAGNQ